MGKCDSLPLDAKLVLFGKITLNRENEPCKVYCQLHMGENELQLRDRHNSMVCFKLLFVRDSKQMGSSFRNQLDQKDFNLNLFSACSKFKLTGKVS